MKRIVLTLMLVSSLVLGVQPAGAQDFYYNQGAYPASYPVGYPVQQQSGNPVLQKVLIGGALIGAGFLAGRLTAPQPGYGYYPPVGNRFPPNYNNYHHAHHHGPQPGFNGRW